MMRRFSAAILGAVLLSSPVMAQQRLPQSGLYIGGSLGQSTFWDVDNVEFDLLGIMFSGIAGYRFSPGFRAEAELLYESADIDNSNADVEVTRFLASAYFDLNGFDMLGLSGIRPYGGIGGGLANVDIGVDDDTEITLHGEVGVSAPIAGNLELVPGIRISYTTLDGGGDDLWVTQLRAGIRYSF